MTNATLKRVVLANALAAILTLPIYANAGTLTIKNEDSADVEIVIEPGEGSVTGSSNQIKQVVKPKQEQKIEVSKDMLGNAEIFSVTGKVKMPSLYNKCSGLFTDKDYKIIFVGSKTGGTICYADK